MLALNQNRLARAGVNVPSAGRPSGFDGHHNVAWELNTDPRFDHAFGTLADVVAQIASDGVSTGCLSSEDFEYLHAKPERLRDIYRAFEGIGYATKVILYLRSQKEYERSLYHELASHHGITESADEFHMLVTRDKMFRCRDCWIFQFDYERLTSSFEQVFCPENVIVRSYSSMSPESHLLADFLNIILPPAAQVDVSAFELPARLNRTTRP